MRLFIAMVSILIHCCSAGRLAAESLQAGAARVEITPPLEMNATLGGYGERMSKPATGVHDRLWCKALCLKNGAQCLVIVTMDILGFPPSFKPELMEKLTGSGLKAEQVILLPSHSHTSIEMNQVNSKNLFPIPQLGLFKQEVLDFLLGRTSQAILDALKELQPVRAGAKAIDLPSGWVRNRRINDGPTDPTLTLLRIDTLPGAPLAVFANFAAHPTFMDSDAMWFSGDWPGHFQRTLEALIGEGVVVLYSNGAEGDQSPVARPDSGGSQWEKAERYGRELAIQASQIWSETALSDSIRFGSAVQQVVLPSRCWHPDFMATGGKEYGLKPDIMNELLEALSPESSHILAFQIDELVLVGIPGELTSILGKELKSRLSEQNQGACPVIGGLADEWISYIMSEEQYNQGGYESSVSFYGPKIGELIVGEALKAAKSLPSERHMERP